MAVHGYIGTYFSENSRGIYDFTFDPENGSLTAPKLFYEAPNAKWVCTDGSFMVFPIERHGRAGICFLELRDGNVIRASEILEEKQTPCYILQDGGFVYTANYHEGNVMVYHMEKHVPVLLKRIENGVKAGCHQILLHGSYLMVPCLEQNRIRLFDRTDGFTPAGEIPFSPGTGPRHGVFNKSHTKFYAVSEWSNRLFVFQVQGADFTLVQSVPVLAGDGCGVEAAAAAVRLTKDERFIYISVRGVNCLCVLDVSGDRAAVIQRCPCGGIHPRDFVLSEDERFLLVVNRLEGGLVSMERDPHSGKLSGPRHTVPITGGVSVALAGQQEHPADSE